MKRLKHWKIGARVLAGFGVVLFLMLVIAVMVFVTNENTLQDVAEIRQDSTLQVSVNDVLDGFNAAQIQANILYHAIREDAHSAFRSSANEAETLFAEALALIDQNSSLEEFRGDLQEAYRDYQRWQVMVEEIIVHNESLAVYRAMLYENGAQLAEVNTWFVDHQSDSVLVSQIKDQITAYRLNMRAIVENLDVSDIESTLAYLDNALVMAEQYQRILPDTADRAVIQSVIEIVQRNQGLTEAFAQESEHRQETVNTAIILGATANSALFSTLSSLDEAVRTQVLLAEQASEFIRNTVILITLISVAVAAVIALAIVRSVTRPVKELVMAAEAIAVGDASVVIVHDTQDELGDLARAFRRMVEATVQQMDYARLLSEGDFSLGIETRSDNDDMSKAIKNMVDRLNITFGEIRISSAQVFSGSQQIAQAAQSLAAGSSEQAAAIEQFNASVNEVQEMARQNTAISGQALTTIGTTSQLMQDCTASMTQMLLAMQQIDEKSQSISKVIKVIDDIAFQTNILALNAAVEAARAGQYGSGFAVVADEVRHLAAKSAQAAQETALLIEESVQSVAQGNNMVGVVNENIQTVGRLSAENLQAVNQIQEASLHQSESMQEIASGIAQISQVVQANSATSEETAASAEEMAAQAAALDQILARFKLAENSEQIESELHEVGTVLKFISPAEGVDTWHRGKY